MTTTQINLVRTKLSKALEEIQQELTKSRSGGHAVDSERRLALIAWNLEQMIASLDMPKEKRHPAPNFCRNALDTWSYDNPLGRLISESEYDYERLK